jgi:hypothetical protein
LKVSHCQFSFSEFSSLEDIEPRQWARFSWAFPTYTHTHLHTHLHTHTHTLTHTHTHTAKTVGKILLGFSQALNVMNLPMSHPNISTLEHLGLRPVVASSPGPADPIGVAGRVEDGSPVAVEEDAKKRKGILRTKFGARVSACVKCGSVVLCILLVLLHPALVHSVCIVASCVGAFCGIVASCVGAFCGIVASSVGAFCGIVASSVGAFCGIVASSVGAFCGIVASSVGAFCGIVASCVGFAYAWSVGVHTHCTRTCM